MQLVVRLGDRSRTNWDEISSALVQAGYTRSPIACRVYWNNMAKSNAAQVAETIRNEQQIPSTPSTTPWSTPVSASTTEHTPYTSEQQYNSGINANVASSPHHAKLFEQIQVRDMLCGSSVEYQHPLQPRLEEALPTSVVQEQGLRHEDRTSCPTADDMSQVPHNQAPDGAVCPSDTMNHNEIQSGSTDQSTSDDVPSNPL
jgi:hypothetical protein